MTPAEALSLILAKVEEAEKRFARATIPQCRVCGGKLSIGSAGGRKITWVCAPPFPINGGTAEELAAYCGGKDWTNHYGMSEFVEYPESPEILHLVASLKVMAEALKRVLASDDEYGVNPGARTRLDEALVSAAEALR